MFHTYHSIYDLLDKRERAQFAALTALTVTMAFVDMLGVASVLPFLSVLADPSLADSNEWLLGLRSALGVESRMDFLMALAGIVFVTVVVGVCVRAATFYALTRFTKMRIHSLASRLMGRYLSRPYEWFLNRNTADLGKSILSEVAIVVDGPIDAAIRLLAHGAIAIAIAGLLIWLEPVGALFAAGIAVVSYGLILMLAHRSLARLGRIRHAANQERFQVAQEAFGGVKEVKVLDLEESYLRRFREPARRMADAHARAEITAELPRHALEGIAIGGMLVFVLWLLAERGGQLQSVLPVLGAYAFAGARLFPELQQVFRSLARIRFGRAALDELHADLHGPGSSQPNFFTSLPDGPPLKPAKSIALRDVTYTYPQAARPSLEDLTLEIEAYSTVGLVGETGAGKSTIVDILLGLLSPQSGEMYVDGVEINAANVKRWRRSVGYVPQSIYLADKSLAANIAFGVPEDEIDPKAVERAARAARLHDFASQLPDGYATEVGERGARISGGQRQRVGIARALYRDPDVIVFDEATSALDTATEKAVMEAVEGLGQQKTVIMITHRLSTVRRCDRIFILAGGRIAGSGTYEELAARNPAFQRIHEAAL